MYTKWLLLSFFSIAGICAFILFIVASPEERITGKWREVEWRYERVDETVSDNEDRFAMIDKQVWMETGNNPIVHKAEIWEFNSAYDLFLTGKNSTDTATWRLKGRGDVLHIQHHHYGSEEYQVKQLSQNSLVLYFRTDLQVRGIIKIVFEKVN